VASIQFDQNNAPMAVPDGATLNRGISNEGAPARHGAGSSVRTNTSDYASYQQNGGAAQARPSATRVQMAAKTGLVKVAGFEVTEAAAATLSETAPDLVTRVRSAEGKDEYLTVDPAIKEAEAAKATADAATEEAARVELNRFADDAAEGVAMHIASDVAFADQTRLLLELHRDGAPSAGTLQRVAEQLHMSVSDTVDALNAVTTNTSLQLQALCNARGVDAQAFSSWMKETRGTEMFKAVQVHAQDRDVLGAWSKHVEAFKARGGKH
jgi:hypothetical protein